MNTTIALTDFEYLFRKCDAEMGKQEYVLCVFSVRMFHLALYLLLIYITPISSNQSIFSINITQFDVSCVDHRNHSLTLNDVINRFKYCGLCNEIDANIPYCVYWRSSVWLFSLVKPNKYGDALVSVYNQIVAFQFVTYSMSNTMSEPTVLYANNSESIRQQQQQHHQQATTSADFSEEAPSAEVDIDVQVRNVVCNYSLPLHIDLRRIALNTGNVTLDKSKGVWLFRSVKCDRC